MLERKIHVYNKGDITFSIFPYKRLPGSSVIMCCSPHCLAFVQQHIVTQGLGKCLYKEKNVLSSYYMMVSL